MPNSTISPSTEEDEASGGLKLWPVLSPGAGGDGVMLQGFSPGRGLQMGPTRPVGMSALRASQAELLPAGFVQREDELPPGTAHLAAAAQVRERKVG